MVIEEKDCRALLSRNIKRFRNRLGLSQFYLAQELGLTTQFISNVERGKKWVSAVTLSQMAKVLKINVFELFKPEQPAGDNGSAEISEYFDNIDEAFIKSIEEAIRPAVKRSIRKMRRYYSKPSP